MQTVINLSVTYKGLDFCLELTEYDSCDECLNFIYEFEITLDYFFGNHHKFDHIASMISAMLADGRHLQNKILTYLSRDEEQWHMILAEINAKVAADDIEYQTDLLWLDQDCDDFKLQ